MASRLFKDKNRIEEMAGSKFRPLADRLIVRPGEEELLSPGGIVLPETAKKKPQIGVVLAVGPGARDEKGKRIEIDLSVGDRILYVRYAGIEIKDNGDELLVLQENDILALVDK
jgi:chaperonin GroES